MTTDLDSADSAKPAQTTATDDHAEIEARIKKSERLLSEVADKGAGVPQESAGAFKRILQWLMRLLSRFSNALTGQSGPNAYSQAHDDLENAKTPAEMAAVAKKASLASKEDSAAVSRMTDGEVQSRVGALLQARAGLDGAEAAVYSTLASSQFKPAPEHEDIIAAALESQAKAIGELKSESESMLEQIRRALQIRGNVSIDVHKLNLSQLTDLAKETNLPDVLKLCEHAKRENGEIKLLKETASNTYKAAWESMIPLEKVQGAASRIWSAEELEDLLTRFAKKEPEVARQRELLEQSRIAAAHNSDAPTLSPMGQAMTLMKSGDSEALRRKAEVDAAKATAERKAAQAEMTLTEEQAAKRAQDKEASANFLKRIKALDADGQGRVLGQDGKPLSPQERAQAQQAAKDEIAGKAQDLVSAASAAAPAVSAVNPAAGATLAVAGTVLGAAAMTEEAKSNFLKLRSLAVRPGKPVVGFPEDPLAEEYVQANETVRALAEQAGQLGTQAHAEELKDDGAGALPDLPKPLGC